MIKFSVIKTFYETAGNHFTLNSTMSSQPAQTHDRSLFFNWNRTHVELVCYGFVRLFLSSIRINHIANIIVDLAAEFNLTFIHNEKIVKVYYNYMNQRMTSILCDFRCPSFEKTPHVRRHPATPIIFKPTINWIFKRSQKSKQTFKQREKEKQIILNKQQSSKYNSKSHSYTTDCLCLTIVVKQHNCEETKFENNGYRFECGLLCISKKNSNNTIIRHIDDSDISASRDEAKLANVRRVDPNAIIANNDRTDSIENNKNINTVVDHDGCTCVVANNFLGEIVNYLETHRTLLPLSDSQLMSNKYKVATKHLLLGNFHGLYRCRGRCGVDGRYARNEIIYNQAPFDKKYCLMKNDFVQICIEKVVMIKMQNIDANIIDENSNKINNNNNCYNQVKYDHDYYYNYNYQVVFRKGEITNDENKNTTIEKTARSQRDEDIIWKVEEYLDFDKFEYVFAIDSVACTCHDSNTGFLYELFVNQHSY